MSLTTSLMCSFLKAECFSLYVQCVVQRECFHAFLDADLFVLFFCIPFGHDISRRCLFIILMLMFFECRIRE